MIAKYFLKPLAGAIFACALTASLLPTNVAAQDDSGGSNPPEPTEVPRGLLRSDPYRYIGRLIMAIGRADFIGSGSVISRHGVLTCGHNMFDKDNGFSIEIEFQRGLRGLQSLQNAKPSKIYVLGGYIRAVEDHGINSQQAFAHDLAILRFRAILAGGNHLSARPELELLKNDGVFRMSLGYGAAKHDGQTLLEAFSDEGWTVFREGYFKNRGYLLEGGMSGGPTVIQTGIGSIVVAVNVSGSSRLSGFRVIDRKAKKFIRRIL